MNCERVIWEADRTMGLNKGSIQAKTSTEQEGIYRGKRSTLKGIHVEPTYTVGKALGIVLSVHFGFLENLFGLLEHLAKT